MDKSQYRLLSANEIDKFDGYDRVVAQNHIANVGCIIVDSTYGDPIDNEYDLDEIYQAIESTKMYESKNRKNMNRKEKIYESKNTIKLTESELKKIISESVKRVLKEGSTVNNKDDYFGNVYYSTHNALGETDSVSTGEVNPFKPSSKYARRDTGIEYDGWPRRGDGYKKLKKLGYYDYEKGVDANEWDPETESYFNNTSDPENAFDLASKVRRQREYNKENDIDLAGKHPNRNAIYQLSKHGFPVKKLSKLSPETLVSIANDLGVDIWFGGI